MVSAVLIFGLLNIIFEMVLLSMVPPKWRLRILGKAGYRNAIHVLFLVANMVIHWGTVVGTMASVMAFVASIITVRIAMVMYGYVVDGRHYHVGFVKYSLEELR